LFQQVFLVLNLADAHWAVVKASNLLQKGNENYIFNAIKSSKGDGARKSSCVVCERCSFLFFFVFSIPSVLLLGAGDHDDRVIIDCYDLSRSGLPL
jgi:hypothetical protein